MLKLTVTELGLISCLAPNVVPMPWCWQKCPNCRSWGSPLKWTESWGLAPAPQRQAVLLLLWRPCRKWCGLGKRSPLPHGALERWSRGVLNQVSLPQSLFGFRSQRDEWVQGRCLRESGLCSLGKRGPKLARLERERRETRQAHWPSPAETLLAPTHGEEHLQTLSGHRATEKQVGP